MALVLRDYQQTAVEALRAGVRAGHKRQILCAPTGAGKTEMSIVLVQEALARGSPTAFITDRLSLLWQTEERFDRHGVPFGVTQAGHYRFRPWEKLQLCSVQTLAKRGVSESFRLAIVDECHAQYATTTKYIQAHPDLVVIGLTATPFTKGLGKLFSNVVNVTTTNKLIADGWLSPFRIFAASEPDMTGAKVVAGEWTEDEAAKRAMPIIGDCVAEYLKHGDGKKFIAFGVNVAHCEELQRQFLAAGVQCSLYTYHTGDDERQEIVREFRKPDSYIRGLISVAALSKGFDCSDVECIIMCRPLRSSLTEHIQILGRGLRAHPGKEVCTILDHAGNCLRHWGPMQEFFEYGAPELDDGKHREKKKPEAKEKKPIKCPKCFAVHSPRPACPHCGYIYPRHNTVEHEAGELKALSGGAVSREVKQEWYGQLLFVAQERGYKEGWAAWKYKEKFGVFPWGLDDVPVPPSAQVANWIRSRQIAWAKRRVSR